MGKGETSTKPKPIKLLITTMPVTFCPMSVMNRLITPAINSVNPIMCSILNTLIIEYCAWDILVSLCLRFFALYFFRSTFSIDQRAILLSLMLECLPLEKSPFRIRVCCVNECYYCKYFWSFCC